MGWMAAVMASAAVVGGGEPAEDPLPRIWDLDWQEREPRPEMPLAVRAFAVFTQFDTGLKIEDHAGAGADFSFGWDYGPMNMNFFLGYAGWSTDNDEDERPPASVRIRQYRAGYNVNFRVREVLELGVGAAVGVYRFRRERENDTSPFLEFEGTVGFRPMPTVKFGALGLATHTESSFNRTHTHLFHNYSAGGFVEISF